MAIGRVELAAVDLGEGLAPVPDDHQRRQTVLPVTVVVGVDGPPLEIAQIGAGWCSGRTRSEAARLASSTATSPPSPLVDFVPHDAAVGRLLARRRCLGRRRWRRSRCCRRRRRGFPRSASCRSANTNRRCCLRTGADVDAAVVRFDQPAAGVEGHVARLGVRRRVAGRAAAGRAHRCELVR